MASPASVLRPTDAIDRVIEIMEAAATHPNKLANSIIMRAGRELLDFLNARRVAESRAEMARDRRNARRRELRAEKRRMKVRAEVVMFPDSPTEPSSALQSPAPRYDPTLKRLGIEEPIILQTPNPVSDALLRGKTAPLEEMLRSTLKKTPPVNPVAFKMEPMPSASQYYTAVPDATRDWSSTE